MGSEISIASLFLEATLVVKLIMVGLLAVSVVSWSFIIQKSRFFRNLEYIETAFEKQFFSTDDMIDLYKKMTHVANQHNGLIEVFKSGFKEFFINQQHGRLKQEVMLENSKRAMLAAINAEIANSEKNLSFLATVGSVSPYVGLFGTVWGIMHSFIALGSVQNATLSMVAPGIAEALIATAIGLFAAIPAVTAYNRYANYVNELESKYERFKINFTNVLARQIYA